MKTKIVATIGPASSDPETLQKMINAGVDMLRINFSHARADALRELISQVKEWVPYQNGRVSLLGDLQGPKIRIGEVKGGSLLLVDGQTLCLKGGSGLSDENCLWINYLPLSKEVLPGENILLDDGKISLHVIGHQDDETLKARVIVGGELTARKGVNLPDSKLTLPAVTSKDLDDLKLAYELGLDWIALSFIRKADDITHLKKEIKKLSRNWNPGVIAKIEKPEAVTNFDKILEVADGVMVARGDLGVEIPYEKIPALQKTIIRKSISRCKPVIVATQMLEGMISNMRPTRAEINDIANSVMDGADALMLSGETSMGKYPVEAVMAMQKIIAETENHLEVYHQPMTLDNIGSELTISDAVIESAAAMAAKAQAKGLLVYTLTGYTARKLSSHRPKADIFTFSRSPKIIRRLNLHWGITGFLHKNLRYSDDNYSQMVQILLQGGWIQKGEVIVKIAGFPAKEKVRSNMVVVSKI